MGNAIILTKLIEQKKSLIKSIYLFSNIKYDKKFLALIQKHMKEKEDIKNKNFIIISDNADNEKGEIKKDDKNDNNNNKQNLVAVVKI